MRGRTRVAAALVGLGTWLMFAGAAQAGWSKPEAIRKPIAGWDMSEPEQTPQLVSDRSGDSVIVWVRERRDSHGTGMKVLEAATRHAGGRWSAPALLYRSGKRSGYIQPRVAIDGTGEATVAWAASGSDPHRMTVYARSHPAAGPWSPTAVIDSLAPSRKWDVERGVALGVGAGGKGTIVFGTSGPHRGLDYSTRVPGGSWARPRALATGGSSEPQVAMDDAGETFIAWVGHARHIRQRSIQAATLDAHGGLERPIQTVWDEAPEDFSMAANEHGDVVLTWDFEETGGGPVIVSTRAPGRGFTKGREIQPHRWRARLGATVVDARGRATILFVRNDAGDSGVGGREEIQIATHVPGRGWTRPKGLRVARPPLGISSVGPAAAVGPGGELMLIWADVETQEGTTGVLEGFKPRGTTGIEVSLHRPGRPWRAPTALPEDVGFEVPEASNVAGFAFGPGRKVTAVWLNAGAHKIEVATYSA